MLKYSSLSILFGQFLKPNKEETPLYIYFKKYACSYKYLILYDTSKMCIYKHDHIIL